MLATRPEAHPDLSSLALLPLHGSHPPGVRLVTAQGSFAWNLTINVVYTPPCLASFAYQYVGEIHPFCRV